MSRKPAKYTHIKPPEDIKPTLLQKPKLGRPMQGTERKVAIHISAYRSTEDKIREISQKTGRSISHITAEAIELFIKKYK